MSEKRVAPRRKVFLVGKIVYGGETYTIDCTIRDISETGARVQVPDPFSVPNNTPSWVQKSSAPMRRASYGAKATKWGFRSASQFRLKMKAIHG
jgi:hypothetical protein